MPPRAPLIGADGSPPTWRETAFAAWRALAGRGGAVFTCVDFERFVEERWDEFAWPHARSAVWRVMLRRVLAKECVMGERMWEEVDGGWRMVFEGEGGDLGRRTRWNGRWSREKKGLKANEAKVARETKEREKRRALVNEEEDTSDGESDKAGKAAFSELGSDEESLLVLEGRGKRIGRFRRAAKRPRVVLREDGDSDEGGEGHDHLVEVLQAEGEKQEMESLKDVVLNADFKPEGYDPVYRIPTEWLGESLGPVGLSLFDKDAALEVQNVDNGFAVRGFKGWRSVRGTHGVVDGDWYYEVTVCAYEGDGAVRLGWSTRRSDIGTPVGFAERSYGLRDRSGDFITNALPYKYCLPFGAGDVIGCRMRLGPRVDPGVEREIAEADLRWLDFRFIEFLEGSPPPNCDAKFNGATLEWFVNGRSLGVPELVQKDGGLAAGRYYPSVSLFKNASVIVNFGPHFKHPPPAHCMALSSLGGIGKEA